MSLRLTTTFNNTRVRNARDCEHQGNGFSNVTSGCLGASGSSFDVTRSPSWVSVDRSNWQVSAIDPHSADETVLDGYVNTSLSDSVSIPRFPLEVWSNARADNKSGFALGPSSSFLERLVALGAAPSRAFGLFFGSRSQVHPMDGSLTIGGYDARRVRGPWTNFTTATQYIPTSCPLQVLVANILLNNSQGSHSLMADDRSTVAACVDPHQNQFTFTPFMFSRFANLTDHPTDLPSRDNLASPNLTSQIYPAGHEDLIGNLTIILSNGYTTVIPHYELVTQERGTDEQGKYAVVNDSTIMVAIGPGKPDAPPLLAGFISRRTIFLSTMIAKDSVWRRRCSILWTKMKRRSKSFVRKQAP